MPKLEIKISGLHCKACEILSEDRLKKIKNITRVDVNHKTGRAEISYENTAPDLVAIKKELAEIGYSLADGATNTVESESKKNNDKNPSNAWLSTILAITIVYLLISRFNFFGFSSLISGDFSWPLALLVGLVAGISTCLALVGGLVLGLAANYAQNHPEASPRQKFRPQLLFNFGRLIGFFLLGGLLGLIGSTFKLSPFFDALLIIFAGLVILILGLKLLGTFPALNNFDFALPKAIGRKIKTDSALLLGALTFFLPCGFTQAMQIYALASGNFFTGGLIMSLFALGTAPGLLGIGGLSALFSVKKSKIFFPIAGAIVIIFSLINLNNGFRLLRTTNFNLSAIKNISEDSSKIKPTKNTDATDVQIIRMTENGRGYSPNSFTIVKDRPVRWIIDAQAPYSCASALIVPTLNISRQLKPGENIIEFTPMKIGPIPFSCSMGMYTGKFQVVEK